MPVCFSFLIVSLVLYVHIACRLEDYLCYAASTVEALGNVMEGTTALEPFNPINMFF